MQSRKLAFSKDVIKIIKGVSKLAFNLNSDQEMTRVFGMTHAELEGVIKEISNTLPEAIFNQTSPKLEEIKNMFAREFIFFQVQERRDDPHYKEDLSNFIHIFSRDIQQKVGAVMANNETKGE